MNSTSLLAGPERKWVATVELLSIHTQLSVTLNPFFCAPVSLLVMMLSLNFFFKDLGISY